MTQSESLITTARRYLIDNHRYWTKRYAQERTGSDIPYTYSDSDYNLFPRYNVLSAILHGVETLVGKNDLDFASCKQQLNDIGLTANSPFTTGEANDIEKNAMQEKRVKFLEFIDKLTVNDLASVEPLHYRRILSKGEQEQVRKALFDTWNFQGDYWDPLEELSPKRTVFVATSNITDQDYDRIINEIELHADSRLFEITEDGSDAERDINLFHPNCYKTIYCDKTYEWIFTGLMKEP